MLYYEDLSGVSGFSVFMWREKDYLHQVEDCSCLLVQRVFAKRRREGILSIGGRGGEGRATNVRALCYYN